MNTSNAYGFVGAGLVMEMMQFLPGVTGVRELWLLVMGIVLMLIGGTYLAQVFWAWLTPRMITPMLALIPRRIEGRGRELPDGRRATV